MTKEEKIDILKKMLWLNFKENFGKKGVCVGLCTIYGFAADFKYHGMRDQLPELVQYRTHHDLAYWWPYRGRFKPWWYRQIAIWKTIRHLKKS
jgi:hypothetical protein